MENPTPGPWHLSAEGAITATAPEGGERLIATVHHPADALLIAAAPDLLQALRGVVDPYHICDDDCATQGCPRTAAAKAAIRQALGVTRFV